MIDNQLQERFYKFMEDWLNDTTECNVDKVVKVEQELQQFGGCETCSYSRMVVFIYFTEPKSKDVKLYKFIGSLAEFFQRSKILT